MENFNPIASMSDGFKSSKCNRTNDMANSSILCFDFSASARCVTPIDGLSVMVKKMPNRSDSSKSVAAALLRLLTTIMLRLQKLEDSMAES